MTLINLNPRDSSLEDSEINLRVEFDQTGLLVSSPKNVPTRISGNAEDLAECEAASTCASDSESVVLFDSALPQSTKVCGSSVIFRNLRPEIGEEDITKWIKSTGIVGEIIFPSFNVVNPDGSVRAFNFGFCTIRFSAPEEAVLLNFLLHSSGFEEVLCLGESDKRVIRTDALLSPATAGEVFA
jgi:hypothetical protein